MSLCEVGSTPLAIHILFACVPDAHQDCSRMVSSAAHKLYRPEKRTLYAEPVWPVLSSNAAAYRSFFSATLIIGDGA